MANSDHARPLTSLHEAVLRRPSLFSPVTREMVFTYCSGLNHCNFCCTAHASMVGRMKQPGAVVTALMTDGDLSPIPAKLLPVLA